MSTFLTTSTKTGLNFWVVRNNDVLQSPDYRESSQVSRSPISSSDALWPRSSFQGADGTAIANIWDGAHQIWEWNFPPTGVHVRKKISGVTKDSTGAVLGGATVQIFNTTTGLLVDTVVSDSAGNYYASDPNAVSCFAVGYETGSPDVAGTTVNTLTGT